MSKHTREYLEEALKLARQTVPGWAFAALQVDARARAGGRSAHRIDDPTPIEKIALAEIRPATLRETSDQDLRAIWTRLGQWFKSAVRQKMAVEDIVNAALFAQDEMRWRKIETKESPLTEQIDSLRNVRKAGAINFDGLPIDLVVVRDFISVVGSTVTAKENPGDLDILVRADEKDGQAQIQLENIWLPLRNVLDPGKDRMQIINSPQGAHGDFVPLYDLILRRRDRQKVEIVKVDILERIEKQEPAKLTNKRANLRDALKDNKGERCGFCQYFVKPTGCKIIDGPVAADQVCDWIQSRDVKAPEYKMGDDDWLPFVQGMVEEQPYQHKVIDGALTPEGPLVLIEDTADPKHRFSLSREFHIGHTSFEHHWTQDEVDRLVQIGRKSRVAKSTPSVPTAGPEDAPVAFVGASPCPIDGARAEPLVGPVGQTLVDRYLKPLNLKRSEVVITHLVPNVMKDGDQPREPTAKEIETWGGWIAKELDRTKPRIIVALGQTAKTALGDRADFMLPHPSVVRRFGTSGSLDRKLPLIRKAIKSSLIRKLSTEWVEKQEREDQEGGGDTRGEVALTNWLANWDEMLPTSGNGRFVVQHHFRGLKEDDIGKSNEQLLKSGRSLHGDIRFEGDDVLWGFAVLGDKQKILRFTRGQTTKGEKNQGAVKLAQPKEWLTIASKKPHIAKPGEAGATSLASAKFFEVDSGTYRLGVARQSFVELFLDGKNLSGRFVFQRADFDGRRVWLIDKPDDQTPTIDKEKTPDRLIRELRRKRQKTLIWAGPDQKPQKIDVATGKIAKQFELPILKAHEARQVVYITVLDPYLFGDAHGDWIPPAHVEETAWRWFEKSRVIGLNHQGKADAEPVESWIVQYPSTEDYRNAMHNRPHRALRLPFGKTHTHSGAWNLGIKLGDSLWRDYKAGKIQSVSVGGFGHKTAITEDTLPDVTFVDLVESS